MTHYPNDRPNGNGTPTIGDRIWLVRAVAYGAAVVEHKDARRGTTTRKVSAADRKAVALAMAEAGATCWLSVIRIAALTELPAHRVKLARRSLVDEGWWSDLGAHRPVDGARSPRVLAPNMAAHFSVAVVDDDVAMARLARLRMGAPDASTHWRAQDAPQSSDDPLGEPEEDLKAPDSQKPTNRATLHPSAIRSLLRDHNAEALDVVYDALQEWRGVADVRGRPIGTPLLIGIADRVLGELDVNANLDQTVAAYRWADTFADKSETHGAVYGLWPTARAALLNVCDLNTADEMDYVAVNYADAHTMSEVLINNAAPAAEAF